MKRINRKKFLGKAVAGGLFVAGNGVAYGQNASEDSEPRRPRERRRKPQLESDLVLKTVRSAHGEIEAVKDLLSQEPRLANATWDWGGGDWETALGAASHMGRRDIAMLLLEHGARKDIFNMAMMGEFSSVKAIVGSDKNIVHVPGPHNIALAFHAIFSGSIEMVAYLKSNGAKMKRGFIRPAVETGNYSMTEWLLDNGVAHDGKPIFLGKSAAEIAIEKGRNDIAELLNSRLNEG